MCKLLYLYQNYVFNTFHSFTFNWHKFPVAIEMSHFFSFFSFMNRTEIFANIQAKQSYLCIGLDPDPAQLPVHLPKTTTGMLEFNKQIILATSSLCVSYKLNLAFYEAMGSQGWSLFEDTLKLIPSDQFIIADAKRGDIGNTSFKYAKSFFDPCHQYRVDAVTVNPYMGSDSILPFMSYPQKWVIALALTSNEGAADFQKLKLESGEMLFEQVIKKLKIWGNPDQLMIVAGATQSTLLKKVRELAQDYFLLVPGIGAQGGDLEAVSRDAMNKHCGLLVNVGRSIIYASRGLDFAEKATQAALEIQQEMKQYLSVYL